MQGQPRELQERIDEAVRNCPKQLFINNEFINGVDNLEMNVIDPATEKVICQVARATEQDIDIAVIAAREAFESGVWREFNYKRRREILFKIASLIEERKQELAILESLNSGKPIEMSEGEIEFVANIFKYYGGWVDKINGHTLPTEANNVAFTRKEPVGVVAQIIPWNYPLLMAAFKIAPVLATGCTSVLKPSELTPLTALKLGEILVESGVPDGVINIVPGLGEDAGKCLADHQEIDKIAFTGSTEVGKQLMRKAAKSVVRVGLELGGKSPLIVMDDCDVEQAAKLSCDACFLNAGQCCYAATRIYVHEDVYDRFLEKVVECARARKFGGQFEAGVEHGPLISKAQRKKVMEFVKNGLKEGAILCCGGNKHEGEGFFIETTVFKDVTDDMQIAKEEIFGPVMCVMKFKDLNEAIQRANNSKYGLAGGVCTNSLEVAAEVSRKLRVGTVLVNTWKDVDTTCPFGGYKESGMGRELGEECLDAYLEVKSVIVKPSISG